MDLKLVWDAFWTIRGSYDGSRPIPIHGLRDGLEMLGLFDEREWMTPLLLGMDQEFGAFSAERRANKGSSN